MDKPIYLIIEKSKYSAYTDSATIIYMVTDNKEKAKSVIEEKYQQMRKDFIDFANADDTEVSETMDFEKMRMSIQFEDMYYKLYVEERKIE